MLRYFVRNTTAVPGHPEYRVWYREVIPTVWLQDGEDLEDFVEPPEDALIITFASQFDTVYIEGT